MASALFCSSARASMLFAPSLRPVQALRFGSTIAQLDSYLVTPKQLSDALATNAPTKISTAPRVIPLCAAWFLPNDPEGRTGRKTFHQRRIPSARFFDLEGVKDHDSAYPHMLPTAEVFAEAMSSLGIRRDDRLVVYDTLELGIFSAPRVGWTLKVFGHSDVHILNNFRLWIEQGFPTESGDASAENATKSDYPVPDVHPEMVVNYREMKDIAKDHGKEGAEGVQVLDLRSEGRFNGSDPEPRPGLPSGHMPGSINIPLPTILDPKTKTMLPAEELRKIFEAKGIDPKKPIISTCGSGVMAAALDAALGEAQYSETQNHRVYDGSWAEWAQRVSPNDGLIKTK